MMSNRRFRDIPLMVPFLGEEEVNAARDSILSSWICGNGPKGKELEAKLAEYLGVRYVLLTTNCTSALHLALMSLCIEGGEAIVPNYTFTSTALAPVLAGCKPVLSEIDFDTANIDVRSLRKKITEKTKVIIPVHYAGLPCDMDEILELAREHNLCVIEDAAQALGSTYKDKKAGTLGDVGCFSFHSVKNITCGEGGALATNSEEIYKKAIVMRDKGTDKYSYDLKTSKGFYEYISIGHNFMLSDILASIALAQFEKLEIINGLRKKHAEYLVTGLDNIESLTIPKLFEDRQSNWNLFTIRVPEGRAKQFVDKMRKFGVVTNTHYVPLHLNSFYQQFAYKEGDFPVSEKLNKSLVRLPMYPALSKEDLDHIIYSVKETMQVINS